MNTVMSTGHTGFIGRHLTLQMLQRGYQVIGVARGSSLPAHPRLIQLRCSLCSPLTFLPICAAAA